MNRLSRLKHFSLFLTKCRLLLENGMSLKQAILIIREDEPNRDQQKKLTDVLSAISSGAPFLSAIHSLLGPSHFLSGIHLSITPPLLPLLRQLDDYTQFQLTLLQSLYAQLRYPAFLIVTCLITLIGMAALLSHVIHFMGASPFLVRVLDVLYGIGYGIFGTVLLVGMGLIWRFDHIRSWWRVTWMSRITRFDHASFIWILSALVRSGIPVKTAATLICTASTGQQHPLLQRFYQQLLESGSIQTALQVMTLTRFQQELARLANETGKLGDALHVIATDIISTQQTLLKQRLSILQPALIGIVGLMVLGMCLVLFLPLMNEINLLNSP